MPYLEDLDFSYRKSKKGKLIAEKFKKINEKETTLRFANITQTQSDDLRLRRSTIDSLV